MREKKVLFSEAAKASLERLPYGTSKKIMNVLTGSSPQIHSFKRTVEEHLFTVRIDNLRAIVREQGSEWIVLTVLTKAEAERMGHA